MQILFLGDSEGFGVFKANKHHMKGFKLFGLYVLFSLAVASCQKEENPLIVQENQINTMVKNAEMETDTLQLFFDPAKKQITIHQFGLSANYQIDIENHYLSEQSNSPQKESIAKKSILNAINWNSLTAEQFQSIKQAVQNYQSLQHPIICKAQQKIAILNDSLKRYIDYQTSRYENKSITKTHYDEIMTDVEDTFWVYMRSMYEEEKIYIESSSNYRSLLMKFKGILNEKQWEEFFSCVYKK